MSAPESYAECQSVTQVGSGSPAGSWCGVWAMVSRQSMVRRSRPRTWLNIDPPFGRPRGEPIAQLGEVESARTDSLRRDVAVLEGNVLLEPGEDKLVDPGDVVEDLGCFAYSVQADPE